MQVTEVTSNSKIDIKSLKRCTVEELRNEFNYVRAEQITGMLFKLGLITAEEHRRIIAENTVTFPTYFSPLL